MKQSDLNSDIAKNLQLIRRSATILTILAVFVTAYFSRDLLLPILLGFLIALTLSPVNRRLQNFGLPAGLSAFILMFGASFAIISLVTVAGSAVSTITQDLPELKAEFLRKVSGVEETIKAVRDATEEVESVTSPAADTGTQEVIVKQPGLLNSAVTTVASTATSLGVALILSFFLLLTGDLFYLKTVQAFPTFAGKKKALTTVYGLERKVSHYLLTITVINAFLGIGVGIAMWIIGVPFPLIWGLAAFALNYMPVIGGIVGTILIGAYSIAVFDDLSYAIIAPITYQIMTSLEAQFITPYLIGKQLELNVVAVFLTIVLWGWLWGVAGALVAIPFLVVFKVICDNADQLAPIGAFLSGNRDPIERAD